MGAPFAIPDLPDSDPQLAYARLACGVVIAAVHEARFGRPGKRQQARADISLTRGLRPWLSLLCSSQECLDAACARVCALAGVGYEHPEESDARSA